jgi:glycosyltransferase involved in cell wall biosynthesis
MSKIVLKKISYIISYRQSNQNQYEALVFVLSLLRSYFPTLEIIVIEQDKKTRLELDKQLNVKQFFVQNSGLYSRSKNFNFGATQTDKEYLVFACSDVFLEKKDYLTLFQAGEDFETVTPHKTEMFNIKITEKETHQFEILDKRPLYTFAGGIVLFSRSGFEKTGGWDERFEGWGGDDNVMSHVIYNKLTSKTFQMPFYHIDHSRTVLDGKEQAKYKENRRLQEEILTLNGAALDRYIDYLKQPDKNVSSQPPRYVLAITTYNRLDYLQEMMTSFFATRNQKAHWEIIIADDNSATETQEYLAFLEQKHGAIIIRNNRVDIHRQVNTILKKLSKMDFDVCFKCDDDLIFTAAGWDDLYWNSIQRNSYDHLVFYDTSLQPYKNLEEPIQNGDLIAHCEAHDIQGCFYTLTKRQMEAVGYFDEQLFGRRGLGHVDYSLRCSRAGFNVSAHPYDVAKSNDFLSLQSNDYNASVTAKYKRLINPPSVKWFKKQLLQADRIYIPYNENSHPFTDVSLEKSTKKTSPYTKTDATFYPERGGVGFIGFLFKRLYNLGITLHLNFIPAGIKKMGRLFSKIGLDLINIEE